MLFLAPCLLLGLLGPAIVSAHARIKYPKPLGAPPETESANIPNNSPIKGDGSDFPCKGMHRGINLATEKKTVFKAGNQEYFEQVPLRAQARMHIQTDRHIGFSTSGRLVTNPDSWGPSPGTAAAAARRPSASIWARRGKSCTATSASARAWQRKKRGQIVSCWTKGLNSECRRRRAPGPRYLPGMSHTPRPIPPPT